MTKFLKEMAKLDKKEQERNLSYSTESGKFVKDKYQSTVKCENGG
jgi:hypothetical protein